MRKKKIMAMCEYGAANSQSIRRQAAVAAAVGPKIAASDVMITSAHFQKKSIIYLICN